MTKINLILLIVVVSIYMAQAIDLMKSVAQTSTGESAQQKLTQKQMSQVDVKLSDVCAQQQERDADEMLTVEFLPEKKSFGKKYNFTIVPPKMGEFRVAFAGDSVAVGAYGNTVEDIKAAPQKERISDNKLGFYNGFSKNFASLLRQLLEKNNKTMSYAMLNYAVIGGKIIMSDGLGKAYLQNCRFEQLTKSLPHVVVLAGGFCDSMDPSYTEELFKEKMNSLIQYTKNLPSKPIVLIMVPVSNNLLRDKGKNCITNPNDPYPKFFKKNSCTRASMVDMQRTYYDLAEKNGLPDYHVVNAWAVTRLNPEVPANKYFVEDGVHPNLRGMGVIAQELFMTMSLSPEIQERQRLQKNGQDEDWNNAVIAQLESQREQKPVVFPQIPAPPGKQDH